MVQGDHATPPEPDSGREAVTRLAEKGFGQLDSLDGLQCSPLHGRARAMTEEHYKLSKTIQLSRYSLINMTLLLSL